MDTGLLSYRGGLGKSSFGFTRCLGASVVRVPQRASAAERRTAFTLIEIMIVVGIIAVLVGLLFPVIVRMMRDVKPKQADAEMRTIHLAIKAYRQEYGKWPAQIQAIEDTTYVTNNHLVIQTLLGSNVMVGGRGMNPKEKVFLSLQVSTNNPDYIGNYLDPWGIPYVICMDENADNILTIACSNKHYDVGDVARDSGRELGNTNFYLTNVFVANMDVGVASFGGGWAVNTAGQATNLKYNTWTTMP